MNEILTTYNVVAVLTGYLLGSIPTAVWVGKLFYKIDVRDHGSGNAGATNTFRVLGKKAGIPVLLFDILKGWAPVVFFALYSPYQPKEDALIHLQLTVGIAAVIGHIFPIWAGFRGGKGIATLLGIILAFHLKAALICILIFLILLIITRMVSVGSMSAAISFPFLIVLLFGNQNMALTIFSIAVAVAVLVTHKKNIQRLLKNEENKICF